MYREECAWLEENYIRCLKEKSIKDEVQNRKCVVENVFILYRFFGLRQNVLFAIQNSIKKINFVNYFFVKNFKSKQEKKQFYKNDNYNYIKSIIFRV